MVNANGRAVMAGFGLVNFAPDQLCIVLDSPSANRRVQGGLMERRADRRVVCKRYLDHIPCYYSVSTFMAPSGKLYDNGDVSHTG